eukprot:102739-Amorphochlora_amoeboformis.AAC.1
MSTLDTKVLVIGIDARIFVSQDGDCLGGEGGVTSRPASVPFPSLLGLYAAGCLLAAETSYRLGPRGQTGSGDGVLGFQIVLFALLDIVGGNPTEFSTGNALGVPPALS